MVRMIASDIDGTLLKYGEKELPIRLFSLIRQLKKENINNEIGACVFFKSFGLRIAKKSDGKISRIEVIRAIH